MALFQISKQWIADLDFIAFDCIISIYQGFSSHFSLLIGSDAFARSRF